MDGFVLKCESWCLHVPVPPETTLLRLHTTILFGFGRTRTRREQCQEVWHQRTHSFCMQIRPPDFVETPLNTKRAQPCSQAISAALGITLGYLINRMTLRVACTQDEWIESLRKASPASSSSWRSFYSSVVGGVVTDTALMLLPIDDHMVHRGHAGRNGDCMYPFREHVVLPLERKTCKRSYQFSGITFLRGRPSSQILHA